MPQRLNARFVSGVTGFVLNEDCVNPADLRLPKGIVPEAQIHDGP